VSIEKSEGLILRAIPFRDTSRIVTAYTAERGLVSLLAKGVRGPKPRFGGALELFALSDLVYYEKESRELQLLSQATLLDPHLGLTRDAERYAFGTAVLEFLLKALAGQEPSGRLYALAAKTLEVLETCPVPSLPAVFRAFEIKAMSFLGHRPELYSCVECGADLPGKGPVGFSPRLGGALCPRCRSALPDAAEVRPAVLRVLRRLLTTTLRALEDDPPSETVLNGAGRVLESFLEEQLPRYEGLRSLRMVRLLAQSRGA